VAPPQRENADVRPPWRAFGQHLTFAEVPPRLSGYLAQRLTTSGIEPIRGQTWDGPLYTGAAEWDDMMSAHDDVMAMFRMHRPALGVFTGLDQQELGRGKKLVAWMYRPTGGSPTVEPPDAEPRVTPADLALFRQACRAVVVDWLTALIEHRHVGRMHVSGYAGGAVREGARYAARLTDDTPSGLGPLAEAGWAGWLLPVTHARGFPDWMSGNITPSIEDHLLLGAYGYSTPGGRARIMAYAAERRPWAIPRATEFVRLMDYSKASLLWVDDGSSADGMRAVEASVGEVCRTRGIKSVCFSDNLAQREFMGILKAGARAVPQHQVTPDKVAHYFTVLISHGLVPVSADAAGFDRQAHTALLAIMIEEARAVIEHLEPGVIPAHVYDDIMRIVTETETLTQRRSAAAAGYALRENLLLSGLSLTSVFGTLYSAAVGTACAMVVYGVSAEAARRLLRRYVWGQVAWGDDNVIFARAADISNFLTAATRFNLTLTIDPGVVYLRTCYGFTRQSDGYNAYVTPLTLSNWSNKFNREHRRLNTDAAARVLGAYATYTAWQAHPYGPQIWRKLKGCTRTAQRVCAMAEALSPARAAALASDYARRLAQQAGREATIDDLAFELEAVGLDDDVYAGGAAGVSREKRHVGAFVKLRRPAWPEIKAAIDRSLARCERRLRGN